jgi:hypothetical protein
MKPIDAFLLTCCSVAALWANDKAHTFAPNSACKECHPKIYEEYTASQHNNATIFKDPIHASVWKKHPKNLKKQQYGCGKCHTPAADNLDAMLTKGKKALPDPENATHNEAIACAYCHRIKDIELHATTNTNVIDPKEKRYYGTLKAQMASPFHAIATKGNDHMANGNVCIGCHSHKKNKWGLNVCSTNIANEMDGANCVSCHMPQVEGSVSVLNETKSHAFHGFPGSHSNAQMLERYIDLSIVRNIDDFIINIDNRTSHALMLHPLRLVKLKVRVVRAQETIALDDAVFARVIGKDGKPAMPWAADSEVMNTMIQHNEKRSVDYGFRLKKGDRVEAVLGYYLVNPKVIGKLGLENDKTATTFHTLKTATFEIR